MPPEKGDAAYLWDMLDAARTVREIAQGITFDQYVRSRTLQLASERAIEIIGEAARFVSMGLRQAHPEIPWSKIVAQRHVIAHHYGAIQHDRLWRVVTQHIPELITHLEPLVPPVPPDPPETAQPLSPPSPEA